MTPRQRVLTTIRHEVPDRIPLDVNDILDQPRLAEFLGIDSPRQHPLMGCYPRVYQALGIDGYRVSAPYKGSPGVAPSGEELSEWGYVQKGDYGLEHWYPPLGDATTVAEVEKHPWPDMADYDYALAAETAREFADEYAVRGPYWWPQLCKTFHLMGMEKAMIKMALEPAVYEAVLEHVFVRTAEYVTRLLDACGDDMPILCLGDDFATQRGMLISPGRWRELFKPRYAKLFEIGKRAGKFVWFHSCGDITPVLGDLIDIGMDVWETVQLHVLPVSAAELKKQYGRHVTFFGGVNTQALPFQTTDEIKAEVHRCIEALGEGGGYICGPDHSINPDVAPDKAVALFEAARRFRQAGYTATPQEEAQS